MDHNSGPGNTGGGFDAGSGASARMGTGGYKESGNTGGHFGSSAMDQNSGPGTGGAFDVGSGAGTGGGYGSSNTTSSANEYGSSNTASSANEYGTGNTTSSSNEYGATSDNHGGKPSMGDKIKGTVFFLRF
jgi:hypothetical protein